MEISIKHSTSTAHKITGHQGKCQFIHGHNYNFTVYFKNKKGLNSLGMVVDFGIVKEKIKGVLDELYDHRMIIWKDDPQAQDFALLDPNVRLSDYNPTVENMCREAYDVIKDYMQNNMCKCNVLSKIKIEETAGNVAHYTGVIDIAPEYLPQDN